MASSSAGEVWSRRLAGQIHFFRALRRFRLRADGGVSTLVALVLPVLFGASWMAMNYEMATSQRTYLQAAADSAVLAAAKQMSLSGANLQTIQSAAVTQAENDLPANLYALQPDVITATASFKTGSVTVQIQRFMKPMITDEFGITSSVISVASTARFKSSPLCVLTLSNHDTGAFEAGSSNTFTANGCSIISDSDSTKSLWATSGEVTAPKICSNGGYYGHEFSQTPVDCPYVNDPLASWPAPPNATSNHCDYGSNGYLSGPFKVTGSPQLQPGVYCGGIEVTNGASPTFEPGDYILRGTGTLTGLKVDANASAYGTGVAFYFTGGTQLYTDPTSTISFSAPSSASDPMVGLIFMEDPNNFSTGRPNHQILSSDGQYLHGTIYFPQGDLSIGGSAQVGGTADYTIIVAHRLVTQQGAQITLNSSYLTSPIPVPSGVGNNGTGGTPYLSQ